MPTLDQGGKGITNSDFDVSITNSTIKSINYVCLNRKSSAVHH